MGKTLGPRHRAQSLMLWQPRHALAHCWDAVNFIKLTLTCRDRNTYQAIGLLNHGNLY